MLKPVIFTSEESITPDTEGCLCVGCNGLGSGGACCCGSKNGGGGDPINEIIEE